MKPSRILIFAKAPVPGKVKTRLIPALGAEGAAALAADMLRASLEQALVAIPGAVELCADPDPFEMEWAGKLPPLPVDLTAQGEGDLGERLARAAARVIARGENAILIGGDCPALDAPVLAAAAAMLATHDAVIHPAEDGGYVLLGLARFDPSIFEGIAWSGPDVAADTIARIAALGWTLHIGETMRDVDEPADLDRAAPQ